MFKLSAVDLEATTYNEITGENKDKIDLIGFLHDDEYAHFKTINEFWNYVDSNIKELDKQICLAHNGGGYDFLFLIRMSERYKKNICLNVVINGRITDMTYTKKIGKKKYTLRFRDSYKLLPSSLKKLGAAFGYPKTEMPSWSDNKKKGVSFEEHYQQSVIYNQNDCYILIKIVETFLKDPVFSNIKKMPLTISSLALQTFKRINNVKRLCEFSNASYFDNYIRKSYSGGRTEVFKRHVDEEYSYLDVNSLYPSVMLKEVPVGKVTYYKNSVQSTECFKNNMTGVYEVKWFAPKMHTPILWERKDFQHAKKLVFGINNKTNREGYGYYALPELLLAEKEGYIIQPLSCIVTDDAAKVFKEYVETFIEMKYKGGAKKEIAKLLLNSLYGKTGQRLKVQTTGTLTDKEAFKMEQNWIATLLNYNYALANNYSSKTIDYLNNKLKDDRIERIDPTLNVYNYTKTKDHRDTNVMWASYITAYARCELWKACAKCNFEQAYVDTDSCIMPMKYKKNMPVHNKEIGKWKEEGVVHRGQFYAPKSYILDITTKGIRQTKVVMKGVDGEILRKFYKKIEDNIIIPYTDFNKLSKIFSPNQSFNVRKITPYKQSLKMKLPSGYARDVTKTLSLNYDKRIVLDNGNTLPF